MGSHSLLGLKAFMDFSFPQYFPFNPKTTLYIDIDDIKLYHIVKLSSRSMPAIEEEDVKLFIYSEMNGIHLQIDVDPNGNADDNDYENCSFFS